MWTGDKLGESEVIIMEKKRIFCKHTYYFVADFQWTPAKSIKTTHCITVRCAKCYKEKKLTPFIKVLDGEREMYK